MIEPIVLVHGGAGNIPDDRVLGKINGVKLAAKEGYKSLVNGGSVLDAVENAIRVMEIDDHFNAGYGSVLSVEGEVEMDASIMEGSTLNAGAVTIVKDIKHPISLARLVMERTPHVLLAGESAKRFAQEQNVAIEPPGSLVSPSSLKALEKFKNDKIHLTEIASAKNPGDVGTVGAVAIDKHGNVAAATSTGGILGKMTGRCSDTSQIGSGTYADNILGGVSTTGHGESIIKVCLAHEILKRVEYGQNAQEATFTAVEDLTRRLKNGVGAITITKNGDVGIHFSSKRMGWAYQKGNTIHFGIEHHDHSVEVAD